MAKRHQITNPDTNEYRMIMHHLRIETHSVRLRSIIVHFVHATRRQSSCAVSKCNYGGRSNHLMQVRYLPLFKAFAWRRKHLTQHKKKELAAWAERYVSELFYYQWQWRHVARTTQSIIARERLAHLPLFQEPSNSILDGYIDAFLKLRMVKVNLAL
jgi:hypothetical protein